MHIDSVEIFRLPLAKYADLQPETRIESVLVKLASGNLAGWGEVTLRAAPLVLPQRERERYFADGFLTVPGYVGTTWLSRLRAVVADKIEESRALTASDDVPAWKAG